jgi:hypothetical protein
MLTAVARPFVLVSAVAVATLLAALPAAMGSAASIPATEPLVRVELDLAASNGFQAHLETSEKRVATLTVSRESGNEFERVTYATRAEVSEEGLKVRFGRLGSIDVAFTPTTTLNSTEPGGGCTGEPRTLREGVFAGTIDFRGERGFVQLEGPQAEGSMSVISPWECPEPESLSPFASISGIPTSRFSVAHRKREDSASLYAAGRHCSCLFGASVHKRGKARGSLFYGATFVRRERMEISRVTSVQGRLGAFVFDQPAGTATLRPPRPLSGRARFEEQPGRDLWRSTIRVPLPGADPLRTGAPGFQAVLVREDQSD